MITAVLADVPVVTEGFELRQGGQEKPITDLTTGLRERKRKKERET